jgi:hypothetical protein
VKTEKKKKRHQGRYNYQTTNVDAILGSKIDDLQTKSDMHYYVENNSSGNLNQTSQSINTSRIKDIIDSYDKTSFLKTKNYGDQKLRSQRLEFRKLGKNPSI